MCACVYVSLMVIPKGGEEEKEDMYLFVVQFIRNYIICINIPVEGGGWGGGSGRERETSVATCVSSPIVACENLTLFLSSSSLNSTS